MKLVKLYIKALLCGFAFTCATISTLAMPAETSIQNIVVSQPQVRVIGNQVEINIPGDEDCTVTIYALTGQVVKTLNANPGITTIELQKGYYIVKCDRVSCRVVVK